MTELYGLPFGGIMPGPLSDREALIFREYKQAIHDQNKALAEWANGLPENLRDSLIVLCGTQKVGCFCGSHVSTLFDGE